MSKICLSAAGFAAVGLVGASAALAVDTPDPIFVHIEAGDGPMGDNDSFESSEVVAISEEFQDCFYITGKLQKDCVWDREPKCALVAYSKPFQISNPSVGTLFGLEQIIDGPVFDAPLTTDTIDGTVRLGVAAYNDAFDFTVNGLTSNGLHGETGMVCLTLDWDSGDSETYEFYFEEGREALRLGYVAPEGATSVTVTCDTSCGEKEVCYDVDYYTLAGLRVSELYCVSVIGGLDYDCNPTDTVLGWYDKNGNQTGGPNGINDDGPNSPYSELCVLSDQSGMLNFAISGTGDYDFNGLNDMEQDEYFEYLENNGPNADDDPTYLAEGDKLGENWVAGASTKDSSQGDVIRLSRTDFDNSGWECPPAHGICGGYCIKVRLNLHEEDGGDDPDDGVGGTITADSMDFNSDGNIDAFDLATLLSFWGPVN